MGCGTLAFLAPLPLASRAPTSSPREPRLVRFPHRVVVAALQSTVDPASVDVLPPDQYVPLHVHSDYSLLDGASQLPSLVARAAELDIPALALTDHGVLYGAVQLVRACNGTEVKPIIGNEMYVVNDFPDEQPNGKGPKRYHLIVLAKNDIGYRNLVKLTTLAHLEGVVGKGIFARPCVNKSQLYQYREGLIISSACLGGEVAQAILNDDIDLARSVATWFRDAFGDDYYLEIQDHGSEEDKKVNPVMIQLSKELSIKVIATNDSHFTNCLDAEAHDALVCIQTGKQLSDENRLRYSGTEYFKSVAEMRQCFVDHLPLHAVDEALYNTLHVADKVESYNLFGATRIPDYPIPNSFGRSHDAYLRHVAQMGLQERLSARTKSGLIGKGSESTYIERLELELDVICQMGFSSYFLVVWDYIHFARTNSIPVGPGRGSAAGSLVAFALRITDVDPIPFNLLFERFLNIERKSMPDIDTDFSVDGREKVISYVTDRYGQGRVAQIITFNRLTSKAVLKDVARVHNVPYREADRLAKLIPVSRGKPATLKDLLSNKPSSKDFKKAVESRPDYREWLDKAQRIEGTNKTFGIHAAGVVISANPLTDIVPLTKAKHGETITQYAMEDVESVGLLKMDFLGLKNLTVIETALKFVNLGRREQGNVEDLDFSVDTLPLDDDNTYRLLSEGNLDGIFQLDASSGMRNVVRELRPTSLEDISSILALYRPGPLDAGLIPKFIRRKHGLEPIEYDHPLLEPILKETYGIMVYQEQIMRIARDLAGYSLGQADILRRAMGKKKLKDMEKERPRFVKGARERGITEDISENLFDMMVKFAEYCFNKSHSTAYAYLTYQTAFLKANYPVEYSAAILTSNMQQSEKLVRYLADARILGVRILPPSVNCSELGFTVHRQDSTSVVRFGFEAVKTVGSSVSQAIIDERDARGPYSSIVDLINRVDLRVLNKRAIAALIQAGAFDELHPNRRILLEKFDDMLGLRRKLRDKRKRWENKSTSPTDMEKLIELESTKWEELEIELARASEEQPDYTDLERLSGEKASIGFYASGHPLENLQEVANFLGCTPVDLVIGEGTDPSLQYDRSEKLDSVASGLPNDAEVMILSCVTELKKVTTAKGRKMARWIIEDSSSRVSAVVFPGQYEVVEQTVHPSSNESAVINREVEGDEIDPQYVVEDDARVIVWGKIDRESSGTVQVIVDDVQRVEDVRVVVVTARYSPTRSKAQSIEVLQNIARDILGESYRGKDRNGTHAKRRRWIKSKPLHEKNRVPLILRFLDEDGNTDSTTHIGNDLRFPSNCEALVAELQQKTGVECVEISVSDIVSDTNGSFLLSFDDVDNGNRVADNALQIKAPITDAASNNVQEPPEENGTAEHISSSKKSESKIGAQESKDERQRQRFCKPGETAGRRPGTALPSGMDMRETRRVTNTTREAVANTRIYDREPTSLACADAENVAWSASKRAEVINSMKWMPKRDIFSEKVFCAGPRMDDFAPSDAFLRYSEEAKSSLLTASRTDVHVRAQLEANLQSTTLDSQVECFLDSQPKIDSERVKSDSDDLDNDRTQFNVDGKPQSHDSFGESVQSDTAFNEEILLCANSNESNKHLPSNHAVLDLKDGMLLDFDLLGFEGLLDAVCLLGGEIARHHSKCECVVAGMTGISASKLVERSVMLRVTGNVSFVEGQCVYVLVDVREVEPNGGRKRVRSLGPVVIMFISRNAQGPMKISTKRSRKLVGSTSNCLEKAAKTGSVPKKRGRRKSCVSQQDQDRSSKLQLAKDIEGNYETLADGGQILSSMCRTAVVCVARAFEVADDEVHAVSVDSVTCSDPGVLHGSIAHQSVSAVMFDSSLRTVNVQVKSVLSTAHGSSIHVTACFSVAGKVGPSKFSNHVATNDAPLFEVREVSEYFLDFSRRLAGNRRT